MVQSRFRSLSEIPGAIVETDKAAKLLNAATNEARKALRIALRERKGRDGILRHRYSNEQDFELHELYDMGTIEGIVGNYQRQQQDCLFADILRHDKHLGYEGGEKYVRRLVRGLVREEVISYDRTTGRYSMSASRSDKPVLIGGRQEFPNFRF